MREDILRIKEGESKLDYIKRIVYGKLVDKTIDEDYTELSLLVFGKEYSSDVARRMFYGARNVFDVLGEEKIDNIKEDSLIQELEEKKLEIIKERKKLQATKLELNRNLTHESRFELFYENIRDEIKRLPLPNFESLPLGIRYRNSEYIQVFTDIHYGAKFKSENNEYSTKICKERFDNLLIETVEYCKQENINKLNVIELGDSIQGMLRMTDIKLNEIPVVQAVVEISRIIANYLNELSKYVYIEYYHTMQSNHSQTRPLGSKASELATEDLEMVIGNYIKDLLSDNDRINVNLSDKDYFTLDVCGYDCLGLHGHQVKNVRGVVKDYSMLHRKFYQYALLGHTHAGQTMVVGEGIDNAIEILVTPSFVGSDPYSDSLKVGAKAMSKIYKFQEGKGLVQTTNIILN
jgi:hypothetical protein